MKKIFIFLFISMFCLTAVSASAFSVSQYLVLEEQNQLSDDSWEILIDNERLDASGNNLNTTGNVDIGDYIFGVLRFNSLINSAFLSGITYSPTSTEWNQELTALFYAEVKTKVWDGSNFTWTLGSTGTFGNDSRSIIQVYTDAGNDFNITSEAVATSTAGSGGSAQLFWEAGITNAFTNWIVQAPVDDITALDPLGAGPNVGTVNFGVNLTYMGVGPDLAFAQPQAVVALDQLFQLAGNGNFTAPNNNTPDWVDATDDFNAFFQPVPEPNTMFMLGLGLVCMVGLICKRKNIN